MSRTADHRAVGCGRENYRLAQRQRPAATASLRMPRPHRTWRLMLNRPPSRRGIEARRPRTAGVPPQPENQGCLGRVAKAHPGRHPRPRETSRLGGKARTVRPIPELPPARPPASLCSMSTCEPRRTAKRLFASTRPSTARYRRRVEITRPSTGRHPSYFRMPAYDVPCGNGRLGAGLYIKRYRAATWSRLRATGWSRRPTSDLSAIC